MTRLPQAVSLILCDSLSIDIAAGTTSLNGIFNSLNFRLFPARVDRFTVFATLHDGEGEGTIQLVVSRLETEEDIDAYSQWFAFPGRGLYASLEIRLKRLLFPAPGRYSLTLNFNGEYITHRYLEIIRRRG